MSKSQKQLAEKKHRMVHNFLMQHFPDCKVEYNGIDGIDHKITYKDNTTYLETKSCRQIIKGGVKPIEDRPLLVQKFRHGRFRFDQRHVYPYQKSQHEDLIDLNGWYVFVVGNRIRGAPAKEVDNKIKGEWGRKLVAWDRIIYICYPDWLEKLKKEVYDTGIEER